MSTLYDNFERDIKRQDLFIKIVVISLIVIMAIVVPTGIYYGIKEDNENQEARRRINACIGQEVNYLGHRWFVARFVYPRYEPNYFDVVRIDGEVGIHEKVHPAFVLDQLQPVEKAKP